MHRRIPFKSSMPSDLAGEEALQQALNGNQEAWRNYLATSPHRDGFSILYACKDKRLRGILYEQQFQQPSMRWLLNLPRSQRPAAGGGGIPVEASVLYETWFQLHARLSRQLGSFARALPQTGFVHYFTEYLEWCLIIKYSLSGAAANLKVVHEIPEPQVLYDIFGLIHLAPEGTRTVMKNVMKSPAKIVAHRGVLLHVDRHSESSVFGPSIDTLFLHETICSLIFEYPAMVGISPEKMEISYAMEPGCGNGFLSLSLLTHLRSLKQMHAFDSNSSATDCTRRNLVLAVERNQHKCHVDWGDFDADNCGRKYDLIVVNPPYIPHHQVALPAGESFRAVGGNELMQMLIRRASDLLSPNGALLMVHSHLADAEVAEALSQSSALRIDLTPRDGFPVLFDLEDVAEDPEWLQFLQENRDLKRDRSGGYQHTLRVIGLLPTEDVKDYRPNSAANGVMKLGDMLTKP
jgi:methylase of polypeptide subunit release factors